MTANPYRVFTEQLKSSSVLGRQNGRLYQGDDGVFSWIVVRHRKRFGVFTRVWQFALNAERPPQIGLWELVRLGVHGARGASQLVAFWETRLIIPDFVEHPRRAIGAR